MFSVKERDWMLPVPITSFTPSLKCYCQSMKALPNWHTVHRINLTILPITILCCFHRISGLWWQPRTSKCIWRYSNIKWTLLRLGWLTAMPSVLKLSIKFTARPKYKRRRTRHLCSLRFPCMWSLSMRNSTKTCFWNNLLHNMVLRSQVLFLRICWRKSYQLSMISSDRRKFTATVSTHRVLQEITSLP